MGYSFMQRVKAAVLIIFYQKSPNAEQTAVHSKVDIGQSGKTNSDHRQNSEQIQQASDAPASSQQSEGHESGASRSSPTEFHPELDINKLQAYDFPILRKTGNIRHDQFISIKRKCIDDAYEAVREYINFVLHLSPIARNEGYSKHIEYIVKGYIGLFWDMPSSKEHHDSVPFGHLTHSLHVACKQAYSMSLHNITGGRGIDSEQTKKQRPFLVLAGFIAGLLHDSNKIFNYDLQSQSQNSIKPEQFSPTYGSASVLDFCLKHPQNSLRKGWKKSPKTSIFYGVNVFYTIVPQSLRMRFSGEMHEYIFSMLNGVKDTSDQAATKHSLEKGNAYMTKICDCVHELLLDDTTINQPDGWGFKVSTHWYMMKHDQFVQALANVMKAIPESIEKVLIESGVMFATESRTPVCAFKASLYFRRIKSPKQTRVSFIAAAFFENILKNQNRKLSNASVGIAESQKTFFDNLQIDPPLPKGLFISRDGEKDLPQIEVEGSPQELNSQPSLQTANEATGSIHDKAPQAAPDAPQVAPEGVESSVSENRAVESPVNETPASSTIVATGSAPTVVEGHRSKALEAIVDKISPTFFSCADQVARSVLSAAANSFGVTQKTQALESHLQKLRTEATIFYFLENQELYARIPNIVKFGWELFRKEIAAGEHPWTQEIPDLPVGWNSRDPIMSKLANHFYYVWRGMGCIKPSHSSTTFNRTDVDVVLIPNFTRGEPNKEPAKISGQFIEFDVEAFKHLATNRKAKGSITDAIVFMFNAAYDKTWTW